MVFAGTGSSADSMVIASIKLNQHFGAFFRDLAGCPPHAIEIEECHNSSIVNYREFRKSCEAARDLFHLTGDCR